LSRASLPVVVDIGSGAGALAAAAASSSADSAGSTVLIGAIGGSALIGVIDVDVTS
jgi:hypothetical protein